MIRQKDVNLSHFNHKNQPVFPLFLVMLFVTAKLICNALFMNHIQLDLGFMTLTMTQSAFSYGLVFILLDLIFVFYGSKNALFVIFIGMLMDGFYSLMLYTTHLWAVPADLSQAQLATTLASHAISAKTWSLFYHGIIASAITYVCELILFAFLFERIFRKKLFLSSTLSVAITIGIHNAILYPSMFAKEPNLWQIYFSNYAVDMAFVLTYTISVSLVFFIARSWKKDASSLEVDS